MNSNVLRRVFIDYFTKHHHHKHVISSSLIPHHHDTSLLFTNAGMVQFKNVFCGVENREYTSAVSCQKCVRVGGKHNDLYEVGRTTRHHTFFEMLGNFSFGEYFKEAAIVYAWHFLTRELGLPAGKLRVSVHVSDDESVRLWEKVTGLRESHGDIVRLDDEENFWSMGNTGPCGPCTEIFYDQGEEVDGDERWLEVWNLVFMQHLRHEDGRRTALPQPCVDTGMGLERLAAVMQGVRSNYDTDILSKLVSHCTQHVGGGGNDVTARILADHVRSVAFLLSDGVVPDAVGRGYVVRRLIRRACTQAAIVNPDKPLLLSSLHPLLVDMMGDAYPELREKSTLVLSQMESEEQTFMSVLNDAHRLVTREFKSSVNEQISGEVAFRLYDTHGIPLEVTSSIAGQHNMSVREDEFFQLLEQSRVVSRASWKGGGASTNVPADVLAWSKTIPLPQFIGYSDVSCGCLAKITAVCEDSTDTNMIWLCVDVCPFYARGGGQQGDTGRIMFPHASNYSVATVVDTVCPYEGGIVLRVQCDNEDVRDLCEVGCTVELLVDAKKRAGSSAHHSATHLLHAALRQELGDHVSQAGSLVEANRLRFDFGCGRSPPKRSQLTAIQEWINARCLEALPVTTTEVTINEARSMNAIGLFSDKYGDRVRVVQMGDASTELCGGTHVSSTSQCYPFQIVSEGAIGAGVRRIEAVCGTAAVKSLLATANHVQEVADELNAKSTTQIIPLIQDLKRRLKVAQKKVANPSAPPVSSDWTNVGDLRSTNHGGVRFYEVPAASIANLKQTRKAALKLCSDDAKCDAHVLLCTSTKKCIVFTNHITSNKKSHANDVLQDIISSVGGRGGGHSEFATGTVAPTTPTNDWIATIVRKSLN